MEVAKAKIPKEFEIRLKDDTPEGYPKKFFALTMVGSSRSGKTTSIVNFIDKLAPAYTLVVVFTPSSSDPTWTALRKHNNVLVADLISNHVLYTLFERQTKLYAVNKEDNHMLIVIDDFGILSREKGPDIGKALKGPELVSTGIKQMLDLLYLRARHRGCSLIVSYHDSLQMSPLVRVNSTHWILYRLNLKQYEKIAPEVACHLSQKDFIALADEYTKQAYHFMYIDLKAHENKDVFKHGKPAKQIEPLSPKEPNRRHGRTGFARETRLP